MVGLSCQLSYHDHCRWSYILYTEFYHSPIQWYYIFTLIYVHSVVPFRWYSLWYSRSHIFMDRMNVSWQIIWWFYSYKFLSSLWLNPNPNRSVQFTYFTQSLSQNLLMTVIFRHKKIEGQMNKIIISIRNKDLGSANQCSRKVCFDSRGIFCVYFYQY